MPTKPAPSLADRFPVIEHTLKNGLRIRLQRDSSVPMASLHTFFRVGSRNEKPGTTGIAHLFEHMMFNGAAKYGPKEFDRTLEAHGGSSNAYTSHDVTAYHEDFASSALEVVLDLESDRMRSLAITPETLEQERKVVMEERRLRTDDDIPGLLDEHLGATMFMAHPYRWPVIGWMADIRNIKRDDCLAFFRTYYAPNNATLYLVGDFEPERALKLIEKAYGDIPAGPPVPGIVEEEPQQRGERRTVVRYPAQNGSFMLAYPAPNSRDALLPVLDVLQYALTAGDGALLTQRLVYDAKLAQGVSVDFSWRLDQSSFLFFVEMKPGIDPLKAEFEIERVCRDIADHGLKAADLERARNILRARSLRELATRNGRAGALGNAELFLGHWREAFNVLERYQAVSSKDVQKAARALFHPDRKSVATLVPAASV